MARTLIRDAQLARPAPRRAVRLPPGYGLALGATASIALWVLLIRAALGVFA